MDLYPTPSRVELLADIDAGRVQTHNDNTIWQHEHPLQGTYRWKVTAKVRELAAAGWVYETKAREWHLTEAGRAVLAVAVDRLAERED